MFSSDIGFVLASGVDWENRFDLPSALGHNEG
jgi:hypothetical protein